MLTSRVAGTQQCLRKSSSKCMLGFYVQSERRLMFRLSRNVAVAKWPRCSRLPFSTKPICPDTFPYPFLSIESEHDAKRLIYYLEEHERQILQKTLDDCLKGNAATDNYRTATEAITRQQALSIFGYNMLPFIGFGVLDNFLMIVAGESIDSSLGIVLGLSTMAAAGLGNILSDVAGVGSAHYVEFLVTEKFGIKIPQLTPEQWSSGQVRWTINAARCIGLIIGCLIGMLPLLFYDEKDKLKKKMKSDNKSSESK